MLLLSYPWNFKKTDRLGGNSTRAFFLTPHMRGCIVTPTTSDRISAFFCGRRETICRYSGSSMADSARQMRSRSEKAMPGRPAGTGCSYRRKKAEQNAGAIPVDVSVCLATGCIYKKDPARAESRTFSPWFFMPGPLFPIRVDAVRGCAAARRTTGAKNCEARHKRVVLTTNLADHHALSFLQNRQR